MGRLKFFLTKRVSASSLTEVVVATSILLLVFAIALLTLNTLMIGTINKDTQVLDTRIEKFIYQYKNQQLKVPNTIIQEDIRITIQKVTENNLSFIIFSAEDVPKRKQREKKIIALADEE